MLCIRWWSPGGFCWVVLSRCRYSFSSETRSTLQPSPTAREHACPAPVLASQHRLPVTDRFSRFYYVFKSLNGLSDLPSPSSGRPRSSEGGRPGELCWLPPAWAGCNCPAFALWRELIVFCFCCVFTANDSRKCLNRTRPLCLFPAIDVFH